MAHVNIPNEHDHRVFVFIRDSLSDAAAFVNSAEAENVGELQFARKLDGVKLKARLRQFWPPAQSGADLPPDESLVGIVEIYAIDLKLEDPRPPVEVEIDPSIKGAMVGPHEERFEFKLGSDRKLDDAVPGRPTTHEDLLDVYNTRASEHGCGFVLAGELDEAASVLVNKAPALDPVAGTFALKLPTRAWGYIELARSICELPRFGCSVTYYKAFDVTVSTEAIEAAFIELLAGAVPQ